MPLHRRRLRLRQEQPRELLDRDLPGQLQLELLGYLSVLGSVWEWLQRELQQPGLSV